MFCFVLFIYFLFREIIATGQERLIKVNSKTQAGEVAQAFPSAHKWGGSLTEPSLLFGVSESALLQVCCWQTDEEPRRGSAEQNSLCDVALKKDP